LASRADGFNHGRSEQLTVILLTGRPGVGKTTLVNRVYEHYSKHGFRIEGLTTREVREGDARTGFMITDLLSGREGWLAKKDLGTGPRVGSYVVVSDDLEKIGVAALERSMNGAADLIIVDEIGPMEMTSTSFRNNISRVLNGRKTVVATVKFGSRYPEVENTRRRSLHWEITKENRESIYRRTIRQVDDWIREPRNRAS
jgi:nucleoside-triphosphatase